MIISRSVARPVNLYKSQVSASQEGNPIGTGGNGSGEARVGRGDRSFERSPVELCA